MYTNTINVDELAKTVLPALDSIMKLLNGPIIKKNEVDNLGDLLEGTLI